MSARPRLLDLFCGAGGAALGYHRAGFEVVGVDIEPQPRYPFEFVQADALSVLARGLPYDFYTLAESFDAIHASPPCQFATDYRRTGLVGEHANLIPETRELLEKTGLSYVIENVEKAGEYLRDPLMLCGSMFDLDVKRHRLFETAWPLEPPAWPCRHKVWADDRFPGATNRKGRRTVEVGVWRSQRCHHPYRVGAQGNGEWTLCDPACMHAGPVVIVNPWDVTVKKYEGEIPDSFGGNACVGEIVLPPGPLALAQWRVLTVHHLTGEKADCRWWNLVALCQRCHLSIQKRVVMEQAFLFEHSEWFKPYAAGFYAWKYLGDELTWEEVAARLEELLALERMA